MPGEKKLVSGFFAKKPHENAPDFVKAGVSLKLADFSEFVKANRKGEWMNIDILESKGGKYYAVLNEFEPKKQDETK